MKLNFLCLLLIFIAAFFIYGCACNVKKNIICDFNVLTNFDKVGNDTVFIDMDLDSVIVSGISVPSKSQSVNGIALDFRIDGDKDEKYFYKIYYQNESYKFSDNDSLSYENFYGSWEDVSIGFKHVNGNFVEDFIRITGNPRNERKFYGAEMKLAEINQERLESVYHAISDNKQWLESIEKKASTNKKSVEEQLYADALWILKDQLNKGNVNHRWKRNPRTGCYSFLLVVCTEKVLEKIPDYIKDVSKTDENGVFVNPYSYFLNGNGVLLQDVYVMKSSDVLKTRAVIKPSNGVYVDPFSFNKQIDDCNLSSYLCGSSHQLYENALFEQYFHTIDVNYYLNNIPVVEDVKDGVYSKKDYDRNRLFYNDSDRIKDHPHITDCPCNTVKVNEDGKYISIINPGNEGLISPKKENVGVKQGWDSLMGNLLVKLNFRNY